MSTIYYKSYTINLDNCSIVTVEATNLQVIGPQKVKITIGQEHVIITTISTISQIEAVGVGDSYPEKEIIWGE
jgi:hypothetical protein